MAHLTQRPPTPWCEPGLTRLSVARGAPRPGSPQPSARTIQSESAPPSYTAPAFPVPLPSPSNRPPPRRLYTGYGASSVPGPSGRCRTRWLSFGQLGTSFVERETRGFSEELWAHGSLEKSLETQPWRTWLGIRRS